MNLAASCGTLLFRTRETGAGPDSAERRAAATRAALQFNNFWRDSRSLIAPPGSLSAQEAFTLTVTRAREALGQSFDDCIADFSTSQSNFCSMMARPTKWQ